MKKETKAKGKKRMNPLSPFKPLFSIPEEIANHWLMQEKVYTKDR